MIENVDELFKFDHAALIFVHFIEKFLSLIGQIKV